MLIKHTKPAHKDIHMQNIESMLDPLEKEIKRMFTTWKGEFDFTFDKFLSHD